MVLPFRRPNGNAVDPTSLVIEYQLQQRYSSYDERNVHDWHFDAKALLGEADEAADDDDLVQVARGEARRSSPQRTRSLRRARRAQRERNEDQ